MLTCAPIYHTEPYVRSIHATVVSIESWKGKDALTLDRTIFYPEGGGQPGDRGTLGELRVLDTQTDEEGKILHILDQSNTLVPGAEVALVLDWEHRYDYMQQHSAQHLLSGTLHRMLGVGTVSVHLGAEDMSIEVDVESIDEHDLMRVEDEVNRIVTLSVAVTSRTVSQEASKEIGLRRPVKVDGDVRLISIGDYDTIACGGVHVFHTGELRYVQYVRSERIRGHLRTFWIAGDRSVSSIRRNKSIVDASGTLLSAPAEHIVESIRHMQQQLGDARYLQQKASVRIASLLLERELSGTTIPLALFDASGWDEESFRSLPESLLSIDAIALCVVRPREDGKLSWMVALKGIGGEAELFKAIRQEALPAIEGKGGGKPPLWQGVGSDSSGKETFLSIVGAIFDRVVHD